MAEAKPVIFDVGARNMGVILGAYSKKLRGLPKKVADMIEKAAKTNIERGFTFEGRFEELSRYTMLRKKRNRTSPLRESGAMMESIKAEELSSTTAVVTVGVPYAVIHEFGAVIKVAKGTTKGEAVRKWYLAQSIESGRLTKPLKGATVQITIPERAFFRSAFDEVMRDLNRVLERDFNDAPDVNVRVQVVNA